MLRLSMPDVMPSEGVTIAHRSQLDGDMQVGVYDNEVPFVEASAPVGLCVDMFKHPLTRKEGSVILLQHLLVHHKGATSEQK
jgi:hypothetical protein